MPGNAYHLRDRVSETEKVTINLGFVDLGRIDLLVQEGFYSNRSDFIRSAIRKELDALGEPIAQTAARKTLDLGLVSLNRADLEAVLAEGRMVDLRVIGLARIADDVTPELALQAIKSVTVLGALQAPPAVKSALADRIQ